MICLEVVDFWRLETPDTLEFTGPKPKNRNDYCLARIDFYDEFFRSFSHLLGTKFGGRIMYQWNFQRRPTSFRHMTL